MKIIIIGADPNDLLNLRAELINDILKKNIEIIASSSYINSENIFFKKNSKFIYVPINLKRHGMGLIDNLKTFIDMLILLKKHKPKLILAYGIKPVIWGGISAKIRQIPFFALITGLGFSFQGVTFKRKLLTKIVSLLYKISLKNSKAVIFQNIDNRNTFVEKGIISRLRTHIVNGSGVDINKFGLNKLPDSDISFLCISRLLSEKGLREYAAAAKIVKEKFPNVKFNLVGPMDSSKDSIQLEEIISWSDYINYIGSRKDVRPYICKSHIFVLPSYHEGLPRSTLEAMSMGRPVITTNAVGCKETVEDGINGFKVPVRSVAMLADKMIWFIHNTDQIKPMGLASRKIVKEKFNVKTINADIIKIIGL